jgi:hypothetical protein
VQGALESLPWVEQGSVKIEGTSAKFKVSDPSKFDENQIKDALAKKGKYSASVVKKPTTS